MQLCPARQAGSLGRRGPRRQQPPLHHRLPTSPRARATRRLISTPGALPHLDKPPSAADAGDGERDEQAEQAGPPGGLMGAEAVSAARLVGVRQAVDAMRRFPQETNIHAGNGALFILRAATAAPGHGISVHRLHMAQPINPSPPSYFDCTSAHEESGREVDLHAVIAASTPLVEASKALISAELEARTGLQSAWGTYKVYKKGGLPLEPCELLYVYWA